MSTFEARYQVDDGYAGAARPKHFKIDATELEDDMDKDDLADFYYEYVYAHYRENVHPSPERVEEFVAWAQEQLQQRQTED
jgi:hypothetical protein